MFPGQFCGASHADDQRYILRPAAPVALLVAADKSSDEWKVASNKRDENRTAIGGARSIGFLILHFRLKIFPNTSPLTPNT